MPKPHDIFMTWKMNGQLENKLATIESLASKRVIQSEIANQLGISSKTFIKLKKKYPEIVEALNKGEESLKVNIMDAILKRALGFKETDEVQVLEMVNGKQKKKITKTTKYYPPDIEAGKYILIVKFGKDFSPKKFELDLMKERIDKKDENWIKEGEDKDV